MSTLTERLLEARRAATPPCRYCGEEDLCLLPYTYADTGDRRWRLLDRDGKPHICPEYKAQVVLGEVVDWGAAL